MDSDHVSDVVETSAPRPRALFTTHCPPGTYRSMGRGGPEGNHRLGVGLQATVEDWLAEEAVEQDLIVERLQDWPCPWLPIDSVPNAIAGPVRRIAHPTSTTIGRSIWRRSTRFAPSSTAQLRAEKPMTTIRGCFRCSSGCGRDPET